jgi:hypothetical protein
MASAASSVEHDVKQADLASRWQPSVKRRYSFFWRFRVMGHPLNVDRDERLIAYNPCIVPWWEQRNVAGLKLPLAAVIHYNMEPS